MYVLLDYQKENYVSDTKSDKIQIKDVSDTESKMPN